MNKKRIGVLGILLTAAVGLAALIGSPQLQSQTPPEKGRSASIDEKLNQILERLERVEKRLDSLGIAPATKGRPVPERGLLLAPLMTDNAKDTLRMAVKPKPRATVFKGCPPAGEGNDGENNIRKNRVDTSGDGKWLKVAYDAIHDLEWPKSIKNRRYNWSDEDRAAIAQYEGAAISIEGYIFKVKPNRSGESCNCGETTKDMIDYHIPLTKDKDGEEKDSIVVEVTPRLRAEHDSWDAKTIQRLADEEKKVRISGWLLFDCYHKNHLGKYRATLWEIHPIMEIEVLESGSWVPLDDWAESEHTRRSLHYQGRAVVRQAG